MPEKKSFKVEVDEEVHKDVKVYCAQERIYIKNYVTSLILNDLKNRANIGTKESIKNTQSELPECKPENNNPSDSNLSDSNLSDSNLSDSNLSDSNLPDSNLPDSNLPDSNLPDSNLPDSNLPDSNLPDPIFPNSGIFISYHNSNNKESSWANSIEDNRESKDKAFIRASRMACDIYEILNIYPSKAMTTEEISRTLPNITKSAAQTALYWLLRANLIRRQLREDPYDKRKNYWEYWKSQPSANLKERSVKITNLLKLIPESIEQAMSVRDLSTKLGSPTSTVRDALEQLEREGMIGSLIGTNHKNQAIKKYCRLIPGV